MDAAARRAAILSVLERAEHPVSAALAREFSVSRQIIVGARSPCCGQGGLSIAATPRGICSRRNGAG